MGEKDWSPSSHAYRRWKVRGPKGQRLGKWLKKASLYPVGHHCLPEWVRHQQIHFEDSSYAYRPETPDIAAIVRHLPSGQMKVVTIISRSSGREKQRVLDMLQRALSEPA